MAIISSDSLNSSASPSNLVLDLKKELDQNSAIFERKKNLYYLAATISIVATVVFCISSLTFQSMTLPFWTAIVGSLVTISAARLFAPISCIMIENAQETKKVANRLREMQSTYQNYQKTAFSESEKIIMTYGDFAEKKYEEAEEQLQKLMQEILDPASKNPKSKFEEMIQLQHQILLLKIDLSFTAAIFDTTAINYLNCLVKKEDLLTISTQDPLTRNRIQGLNSILQSKFTKPLLYFKKIPKEFSCQEIQDMRPETLTKHMVTLMNESSTS